MKIQSYKTHLCGENAYWMAVLCDLVYTQKEGSPKPDEATILQDLQAQDSSFESVIGFSKNSSQAMFVEHADYLAMVFRGTDMGAGFIESARDWLDNLNAFPEEVLFGSFHRGFWNATHDIWSDMDEAYQTARSKKKRPLFITGHSLGGAMATIAASIFIHSDRPFTSVYTFGQPRVMDREATRIFNTEIGDRFFRFQNNSDIVSRLPARAMGYRHVGKCVYIDVDGDIHDDPGFWFRFLDVVEGAVDSIMVEGLDMIEDHDMRDYASHIKTRIKNCLSFPKSQPPLSIA